MKGFPGGLQQLMKQANQMQMKMQKTKEELATRTFEATSGGSAVTAIAFGNSTLKSITISEDVFKSGDAELLQDMVVSAVNEALRTAKEANDKEMEKITGGMGMPGMF